MARRLVALLTLLSVAACTTSGGTVDLSWRLTDGRACDLAGIVSVSVEGAGPRPISFYCRDGVEPDASVPIDVAELPVTLTLRAATIDGAVLYRGERRIDEIGPVAVSLRFVGGE